MSPSEIDEVRTMISSETDEGLALKLQALHRAKLSASCLFNPTNRAKVDLLVSLIGDELQRRRLGKDS